MINLTIDTSVFGLPKKEKVPIDKDIQNFIGNILCFQEIKNFPHVTISLVDSIPQNLEIDYKALKSVITDYLQKHPQNRDSEEILSYYFEICEICDKLEKPVPDASNQDVFKGTGIHYQLPSMQKEMEGVKNVEIKNYKYPTNYKNCKKVFEVFKSYSLRISRLNKEYNSTAGNYLVIDGDYFSDNTAQLSVTYSGENGISITRESEFNLIGIQKVKQVVENCIDNSLKITTVFEAVTTAKEKSGGELIFLPEVNKERIDEEKLPAKAGPPLRIYYYLQTLGKITKANSDTLSQLSSCKNGETIKKIRDEISEMINAWGCLCSPESISYIEADCTERRFVTKGSDRKVFTLHLKPSTNSRKANTTVRIYFDLFENKFRIAFIGHHPKECKVCDKKDCSKKREYRESKYRSEKPNESAPGSPGKNNFTPESLDKMKSYKAILTGKSGKNKWRIKLIDFTDWEGSIKNTEEVPPEKKEKDEIQVRYIGNKPPCAEFKYINEKNESP